MVEQAKKQQGTLDSNGLPVGAGSPGKSGSGSGSTSDLLKQKQQDDESKIAKHIQEYQRALMKQQQQNGGSSKTEAEMAAVILKQAQQQQNNLDASPVVEIGETMNNVSEPESSTGSGLRGRRRGRPPKNSNLDLSYSPPDKRARTSGSSPDRHHHNNAQPAHQTPESSSSSDLTGKNSGTPGENPGNAPGTTGTSGSSGKGGKGIRNRVFCGECPGCLKNDDCGKCRYCKDKTKFGGQNRLRQKCLHRRCQLDTHRRRASQNNHNSNSHNNANNNSSLVDKVSPVENRQSPSPDTIYSGVDLARLASQSKDNSIDKKSSPVDKVAKNDNNGSPVAFPNGLTVGKFTQILSSQCYFNMDLLFSCSES